MCLGNPAPAVWFDIPERELVARAKLTSEQCIIDGSRFFLRGRLVIPVKDAADDFVWLIWVSMSEADFKRAREVRERSGRETEQPYAVLLESALPYPGGTLSLAGMLHTRPRGERPVILLDEADHVLVREQKHGIDLARVQEIVESELHVRTEEVSEVC